jgi:hypothetical protein
VVCIILVLIYTVQSDKIGWIARYYRNRVHRNRVTGYHWRIMPAPILLSSFLPFLIRPNKVDR